MTEYVNFEPAQPEATARRARLLCAIAAVLVMLMFVGVIEVGALAAVTIVSSGQNRR